MLKSIEVNPVNPFSNSIKVGQYPKETFANVSNAQNPRYKFNLTEDVVSFPSKKKAHRKKRYIASKPIEVDLTYKNILDKPLKSTPNPNFKKDLAQVKEIYSLEKASLRVSSLSRYLKEDMIGFIVPKYGINETSKGGYEWFGRGLENLLKGSKQGTRPDDYQERAKELFGLLSTHDAYWKSPQFVDYLESLKQRESLTKDQLAAVNATQSAVHELQENKGISFTGYFTPLKMMDKILNDGCAYTGEKLVYTHDNSVPPNKKASAEHIFPKSWGGPNDDANFLVASAESNSQRGNIDLLNYLKGEDA